MGKASKIYIKYDMSPRERSTALLNADENDLRILAALLLSAGEDGETCADGLCEQLGLEVAEVNASLKFWRGAGIVTSSGKARVKVAAHGDGGESDTPTAHRGGAVARFVGVEDYTNDELTAILEKHIGSEFIDEAQRAMGKIFNKNEISKLVGMTEQLGFEPEAILAILSYCVRLGKKSLSYAERVAISFHDEEIFTAEEIHARIDYLEKRNSVVEKVRNLFGFGGRSLTTNEKKLFASWTEELGYDFDIIQKAYEITVDTIHEPAPKYTNGILKKWHENGLGSVSEIDAYMESERQRASQAVQSRTQTPRSGVKVVSDKDKEMEEWFEQRLRNTFGE